MASQDNTEVFYSGPKMAQTGSEEKIVNLRAEIDTSAPFESVKEAATRFGGMGFWKPVSHKPSSSSPFEVSKQDGDEMVDIAKLEEQAAELEKELIVKERETLDVLKELETTKMVVEELKANLQKETAEVNEAIGNEDESSAVEEEKENHIVNGLDLCPSSAPGFILLELKQAKLNLARTTNVLTDIRATVESYNKKIEKERLSLEKTRRRLSSKSSKVSSLEKEINQTKERLEVGEVNCDDPKDIARELRRLSSETEKFKKVGEAARSEVMRATSEIEQTKGRIKTAEIRLVAAKKMKEASRAAEAVALAEIKAISNNENSSEEKQDVLTITFEEYSSLMSRVREAEETCQKRVADAMLEVDDANASKSSILKKVEEAREEVKNSKKALEEALGRVEAANKGKLAVEEALRKWRSERGQKRRSLHNSTKFKNPSHQWKESRLLDVNGVNMVNDENSKPVLKPPTLSIGQILSRKLLLTEGFENGMNPRKSTGKRKVSLAQMLGKHNSDLHSTAKKVGEGEAENTKRQQQQLPAKRKKFGFARISVLVAKQNKKKNKQSAATTPKC